MKRLLISAFIFTALPLEAQFLGGFCSTVGSSGPSTCASESTSWLSKIESAIDRANAYAQDTLHLNETIKVFNLGFQMSQYITNAQARWPSAHYAWQPLSGPDTFGINSSWQYGMNTGMGSGLGSMTSPLNTSGISGVPYQFQGALQQGIASIERHDTLTNTSMSVIGGYMGMSAAMTRSLVALATSVTGLVSGELTYAAALQKVAGAQMLSNQSLQMSADYQQRQLMNQQAIMINQRQAAANELNYQIYTYQNASNNLLMTQNSSNALYALQVP